VIATTAASAATATTLKVLVTIMKIARRNVIWINRDRIAL